MTGILHEQPYPGATSCIVVGGLGAVAPNDFSRFRSVLWCVDALSRAETPRGAPHVETLLVDGTGRKEALGVISRFTARDPRHLPTVIVTQSVSGSAAASYGGLLDLVLGHLEAQHRARLTRQKDAFAWQKHVLLNLPAYAARRIPASWQGALRGLPAFVCASGPSLDASAPVLAAIAGSGVVLAADSALNALARLGVTPDFAVSIDAAKVPERCLPPQGTPSRMILGPTSPASWHAHVPREAVFLVSGRQVTLDWLAGRGVLPPPVEATENCGSTALGLAYFLGCSPIYLFGLDLALDPAAPERRHHSQADPALYQNSGFDPSKKAPLVPGNAGIDVPSPVIGDLRALNARLATWPRGLVVNVNDRGARIENTTVVAPSKLVHPASDGSKHARLAALAGPEAAPTEAAAAAFKTIRSLGARGRDALPGIRSALAASGPAAAAAGLAHLVSDPDFGQAFGAFALKLMPHLIAPHEESAAFWETLLSEMEELLGIASRVGLEPSPSAGGPPGA